MKKKVLAFLLVAVMVFTLTGCLRVDIGVEVKTNGKADISVLYAVAQDLVSMAGESAGLSAEDLKEFTDKGYTYEEYSEDGYVGYRISGKDVSLDELSDGNSPDMINEMLTKDGNKYILDYDMFGEDKEALSYLGIMDQYGGYMNFTLTTPVAATNHNATSVTNDGKTLIWNLLALGDENIHAEFELPGAFNLLYIIIAVAAVAVLAAVVIVASKKKKAKVFEAEMASYETPIQE